MRAGRQDARIERRVRSPGRVERGGPRDVGRAGEEESAGEGEPADGHRHLNAVDERQPLLRGQGDRPESGVAQRATGRQRAPLPPHAPLSHQAQGQVRERSEVSRRADGTLLRHDRQEIGVKHVEKRPNGPDPDAREPLGQGVRPQEHHRSHGPIRERLPDAGAVAAHQVSLKLLDPARGDRHVRELSESGRDAVDPVAPGDRPLHDSSRSRHRAARGGSEGDARAPVRDVHEVVERQAGPRQDNPFHAATDCIEGSGPAILRCCFQIERGGQP